jgi:hypothetical protein
MAELLPCPFCGGTDLTTMSFDDEGLDEIEGEVEFDESWDEHGAPWNDDDEDDEDEEQTGQYWIVTCETEFCYLCGPMRDTKDAAVLAWNTRMYSPQLKPVLEDLEDLRFF